MYLAKYLLRDDILFLESHASKKNITVCQNFFTPLVVFSRRVRDVTVPLVVNCLLKLRLLVEMTRTVPYVRACKQTPHAADRFVRDEKSLPYINFRREKNPSSLFARCKRVASAITANIYAWRLDDDDGARFRIAPFMGNRPSRERNVFHVHCTHTHTHTCMRRARCSGSCTVYLSYRLNSALLNALSYRGATRWDAKRMADKSW